MSSFWALLWALFWALLWALFYIAAGNIFYFVWWKFFRSAKKSVNMFVNICAALKILWIFLQIFAEIYSVQKIQPWPSNEQESRISRNTDLSRSLSLEKIEFSFSFNSLPRNWFCDLELILQPHDTIYFSCKFGHQMAPFARVRHTDTGNSRYREFFIFLVVSEPVSEKIGTGKKSRYRYRKNLVP